MDLRKHFSRMEKRAGSDDLDNVNNRKLKMSSGITLRFSQQVKDFNENDADTEDKIDFTKIGTMAGVTLENTKKSKTRKAHLRKDVTIDKFHKL